MLQILAALFKPRKVRRVAEQRAAELLHSHLTCAQRDQLNANGWFEVTGGDTGRRYVIRNTPALNIEQLDSNGHCVKKWCFGPKGYLAQGDVLLAQKLALECFESDTLALANGSTPDCNCVTHPKASGR